MIFKLNMTELLKKWKRKRKHFKKHGYLKISDGTLSFVYNNEPRSK